MNLVADQEITEEAFKKKARRLLFNSELKEFPVLFHMYVRTFIQAPIDMDWAMGEIIKRIREAGDQAMAYVQVCEFLDYLDFSVKGK